MMVMDPRDVPVVVMVMVMVMHPGDHDRSMMVVMMSAMVVMLNLDHGALVRKRCRQQRCGATLRNGGSEADGSGQQRNPNELKRHISSSKIDGISTVAAT